MSRLNPPKSPDNAYVANFSPALYRDIANLPNSEFISLRNRVLSIIPGPEDVTTEAIQTSFYSNGVTGLWDWLESDALWNAAAQHDFRYTIGPNVSDSREEADLQFENLVREQASYFPGHAELKALLLSWFGGKQYKRTGTVGDGLSQESFYERLSGYEILSAPATGEADPSSGAAATDSPPDDTRWVAL